MVGKRPEQNNLFDVGNVWDIRLKPKSFHGQLAPVSHQLFSDEEFAALYVEGKGRPSVPPSLLALVVLMQVYENLSDQAAIDHTEFDLRWCAVLGREAGTPLCAKSSLQLFRAHMVLDKRFHLLIERSLEVAKGRGQSLTVFLQQQDLNYLHTGSVKGSADIDWSDAAAREGFLSKHVAAARRLVDMMSRQDEAQMEAGELVANILCQDISETRNSDGSRVASVKQGTPPGRIPSVTDPEQRHGRKSKSKKFVGSKSSVIVDTATGLVLATDVLPGDAGDATGVLVSVTAAVVNLRRTWNWAGKQTAPVEG